MKNLLLNCFLFDWFKAKASNPEEASYVKPVDFNPKDLHNLEQIREPVKRFKEISNFLVKTLLSEQDLCKLDLSTFSPSENSLEKATAGAKLSKTFEQTRLGNRLESYHLDEKDGALQACYDLDAVKEELALPTLPSLVYLYYLRNSISYLRKSGNRNPNLKINFEYINDTLQHQIVEFNKKNNKSELKSQLFKSPTVDTNIDLLSTIKDEDEEKF